VLIVGVGLPRIEGDAVNGLFLALVLFFAAWAAQAVDAHRRALRTGGAAGGAFALPLLLLPVAALVFGGFWMVGGSAATASATMERYVEAWRRDRPEQADGLFFDPGGAAVVAARWAEADAVIATRLADLADRLGPQSGLDLEHPLANLEFRPSSLATESGGLVTIMRVVIVRQVSVRSSFLGLIPTAVQQTEELDQIATFTLDAAPLVPSFGLGAWPETHVWRITGSRLVKP